MVTAIAAVATAMSTTTTGLQMVSVSKLLSSCISAGRQGSEVIRDYRAAQCITTTTNGNNVNDNSQQTVIRSLLTKVEGDAKSAVTQADYDAQVKIVQGLRNLWGDELRIIGEEDDAVGGQQQQKQQLLDVDGVDETSLLRTDLLDHLTNTNTYNIDDDKIPMDELTIFVDPLDGTREFVEGRIENVACLIGIARNKKALGGIIGLPFPERSTDSNVVVHYALLNLDDNDSREPIIGVWPPSPSRPEKKHNDTMENQQQEHSSQIPVQVLTGDTNDPILRNATALAMSIASRMKSPPKAKINKSTLKKDSDSHNHKHQNHNPNNHRIVGGTAAKLRIVATEENSIAILHFVTELWDSCGPEALVHARGGKVTDLFGSPLVHSPNRKEGNVLGVVASSGGGSTSSEKALGKESHINMGKLHDELCHQMRADETAVQRIFGKWIGTFRGDRGGAQAVDIAKNLDGEPLDKVWIEAQVLGALALDGDGDDIKVGTASILKAYAVPESDTARGMMSNGCRLLLEWDTDKKHNRNLPSSVFYKRVVMSDLAHARDKLATAPKKLQRDVTSYKVETAFLTSRACQHGLRNEAGVRVTRAYGSDLRPAKGTTPSEQIESRFAMLLEDFSEPDGWTQQWLLDEKGSRAALNAFAKMHAYFWQGSDFWSKEGGELGRELEEGGVWPSGNYMQPALQGFEQLEKVAEGYKKTIVLPSLRDALLAEDIPELEGVDIDELGERLQKIAKIVGDLTHPFFNTTKDSSKDLLKYRTLIHGDPKQANIFLRKLPKQEQDGNNDDDNNNNALEAGLIDFQWTGFGLAAADVAHCICAALQPSCLSYDGSKETELLDYYYDCLSDALVEHGVASSKRNAQDIVFPRQVFQEQYDVAVLDICRMVFAYAWARFNPQTKPSVASLNRNAYNKSLPNALWLITRCSVLLSAKEDELLTNITASSN